MDARCQAVLLRASEDSREHAFPLGTTTKTILTPRVGKRTCFFPALGKETPFNSYSKCKPKLERRCGVSDGRCMICAVRLLRALPLKAFSCR